MESERGRLSSAIYGVGLGFEQIVLLQELLYNREQIWDCERMGYEESRLEFQYPTSMHKFEEF